ncbi:MAG: Isoquinoline 1-oxidoreductase subunit [Polyangiales bacterium]
MTMRTRATAIAAATVGAIAAVAGAASCDGTSGGPARTPPPAMASIAADALRPVKDFEVIADRDERSRALFLEATRVMFHPRCMNCHPNDDVPKQGDHGVAHDPPVLRGPDDHGVPGMECGSCHQDRNLELARVPGAPKWHLAPKEMFWAGRTAASLCAQLKNDKTNGGKTVAQIVDHSAHDPLVAWGWAPGHARVPAPGTQAQFGELMQAWMDTGAACPGSEEAK